MSDSSSGRNYFSNLPNISKRRDTRFREISSTDIMYICLVRLYSLATLCNWGFWREMTSFFVFFSLADTSATRTCECTDIRVRANMYVTHVRACSVLFLAASTLRMVDTLQHRTPTCSHAPVFACTLQLAQHGTSRDALWYLNSIAISILSS